MRLHAFIYIFFLFLSLTKPCVLMQVSKEVYLSALQKLARCFALVGQNHQAHLTKVMALKASHRAEVEEVIASQSVFLSFEPVIISF